MAKTVALSSFPWQEIQFAMFTTAFDAGGSKDDQKFVVVAGFIAPAGAWIEFDKAWRERLNHDGLSYFHMVDFAQSHEEFEHGWRDAEPRRRALLADLTEIISKHASRKFGRVVVNELFLKHSPTGGWDQYSLDPYSFAGMSCVADVQRWCIQDGSPQFENIRFVFEDGDRGGKGKLMTRFHDLDMTLDFELKKDTITKLGVKRRAFTPLQAADFLAYEVLKMCKDYGVENFRWGIKEFQRMQGEVKVVTPEVLIESARKHRVSQREDQ